MKCYGQAKGRRWTDAQPEPTLEQLDLKRCNKCGLVKPKSEFYMRTDKRGFKHPRSICKACDNERSRECSKQS